MEIAKQADQYNGLTYEEHNYAYTTYKSGATTKAIGIMTKTTSGELEEIDLTSILRMLK